MATSRVGPLVVDRASPMAPVPRPPQPTRASWMVLFSAAWTLGIRTPARADAAAIWPDVFSISRRDRPLFVVLLTTELLPRDGGSQVNGQSLQFPGFAAKVNRLGPKFRRGDPRAAGARRTRRPAPARPSAVCPGTRALPGCPE